MEVKSNITKEQNLRIHKITGKIIIPELMKNLRDFYQSNAYDPDMHALWDLRLADFSEIKPDQVRALVDMVGMYWGQSGKGKSALVAPGGFEYGVTRMYEILMTLSHSGKVRVFNDYDEAERWLSI